MAIQKDGDHTATAALMKMLKQTPIYSPPYPHRYPPPERYMPGWEVEYMGEWATEEEMETEKHLQDYIRRGVCRAGASFDKVESRSRRGFPDCFIARNGGVWLVEVKSPAGTGKLSPMQERVISSLMGQGVNVFVIDSTELADSFIEMVAEYA